MTSEQEVERQRKKKPKNPALVPTLRGFQYCEFDRYIHRQKNNYNGTEDLRAKINLINHKYTHTVEKYHIK